MTFLQPLILWGLPLILIPVIIHLINRLRHRPQPWAAMRFLRSATQSSISQAKLRQLLVLLFRMLAVAALIFFLSRPLAGGWLGWALSPAPEAILLILDRSPSMETRPGPSEKSYRETALQLWSDALKQFEGSSRFVLIDSASSKPQELSSLTLLADPSITGATDLQANMPVLLQRAFNYLLETRSGVTEVWIASDLQRSNWRPDDAQWNRIQTQFAALPQKVRFRLLAFDEPLRPNVAITLGEAVRRSENQQARLDVILDLEQTMDSVGSLPLSRNLDGNVNQLEVDMTGLNLRWRSSFSLGTSTNSGWGSFALPADANPRDNEVFFVYSAERLAETLVVSTDTRNSRALRLASADLSQDPPSAARRTAPEDFASANLTNVALIVWAAPLPGGSTANLLEQFVDSGGVVVCFPPDNPSAFQLAGLGWGEIVSAEPNTLFKVTSANELEGPLAKTEEGFGVPMRTLEIFKRAAIAGNGNILASFESGAPFLVRRLVGKGEVYFCATSAEPSWSTLADGSVLVPMLQRLRQSGARRVNSGQHFTCEELSLRNVQAWTGINGENRNPRVEAGIYRDGDRLVAVNRSVAENQLERSSVEDLKKLFGNLSLQLHQQNSGAADRLQGEIWRVFLFVMLLLLIGESLLVLPPKPQREPAPLEEAKRSASQEVNA